LDDSTHCSLLKKLLTFAAIAEAAMGLALLILPSLVSRLLLGAELTGVSVPLTRVTGIALVALGIACWPRWTALCGMLTYGALVTLYLAYLGIAGEFSGILLWPAVLLHAVLTILLARSWFNERGSTVTRP
jgi:hypothetical protein